MTDRELMQQALEALEKIAAYRPLTFAECSDAEAVMGIAENAIPVLRERLRTPEMQVIDEMAKVPDHVWAQPEPEPVAWGCNRYIEDDNGFQIGTDDPELAWGKYAPDDNGWWPLYTTPPQRKPLTDEEIGEVAVKSQDGISPHDDTLRFARAIEAAHGTGREDVEAAFDAGFNFQQPAQRTLDADALYAAWSAVGADVAGLKWDDFLNKLKENEHD